MREEFRLQKLLESHLTPIRSYSLLRVVKTTVEANEMSVHFSSNAYSQVATEFIQQIRQDSPSAAECIEQIQGQYGTRAAYLAAFALLQLKRSQVEHGYPPNSQDLHAFTYCEEMRDTPEAIQLYEAAANH